VTPDRVAGRVFTLSLLLSAFGCSSSNVPSGTSGWSNIVAQGVIADGPTYDIDTDLAGVACERLGWLNFWSKDGQSVLVFAPAAVEPATGLFEMGRPETGLDGWLNAGPHSVHVLSGTTSITMISDAEVRGALDWVMAIRWEGDSAPNVAHGTVHAHGSFRAVRVSDDCPTPKPAVAFPGRLR
jgi:hypothetical protein